MPGPVSVSVTYTIPILSTSKYEFNSLFGDQVSSSYDNAAVIGTSFATGTIALNPTFYATRQAGTTAQFPTITGAYSPDPTVMPSGLPTGAYTYTVSATYELIFTATGFTTIAPPTSPYFVVWGYYQDPGLANLYVNATPPGGPFVIGTFYADGTYTFTGDYFTPFFSSSPQPASSFFHHSIEDRFHATLRTSLSNPSTPSIVLSSVKIDAVWTATPIPPAGGPTALGSSLAADTFNNVIAMIWSSGTDTRLARHLSPSQNIGSGTSGWETSQVISSLPSDVVSVLYASGDNLIAVYQGSQISNTSAGAAGAWSSPTTASFTYGGSVGRSAHRTGFWFTLTGSYDPTQVGTSGLVSFLQDVSSVGVGALGASNIDVNCVGQRSGGVWLDDRWLSLNTVYDTASSTEKTGYVTSTNGRNWTSRTFVASISDRVCSLIKTQGDRSIVGLTWNSTSKKCRAIRSYDKGITWEQDTSDIIVIPALDIPPTLVPMQDGVYCVWQIADVPNFAYSGDAGKTWT